MQKTLLHLFLLVFTSSLLIPVAWAESGSDSETKSHSSSEDIEDDKDQEDENNHDREDDNHHGHREHNDDKDEIDDSELTEELESDFDLEARSGERRDHIYISAEWGSWDETTIADVTDWSGTITFTNAVGRPHELLAFDRTEDALDYSNSTKMQTAFVSSILDDHDGILFKVKSDLEKTDPVMVFQTAFKETKQTINIEELMGKPDGMVVSLAPYQIRFKAWGHEDWLEHRSDEREENRPEFKDHEKGSWYEDYMNYSVDEGFFQGFKDSKGQLTGEIRPGSELTRFQALKVLSELSEGLNMGLGERNCDPETVTLTSDTDWMKDHWARGYVQCAQNSELPVTMLNEVIAKNLDEGEKPALRWEVIATAFELLDIDTVGAPDTKLTDVHSGSSNLKDGLKDMIDEAVNLGVVSGYPEGDFKPFKPVNRAEMFKIITLFNETLSF